MWPYSGHAHREPIQGSIALKIENIKISYEKSSSRLAINDVSMEVCCGQRMALVGPNGAGKSTLLKAAAGLVPLQAGSILVYGNPVGACHHRTAYLPQRADVDWHFPISASELAMAGRYVHLGWFKRPTKDDHRRVAEAFERMGISDLARRQISELSGGQQQRVLIARGLVQEASLLLFDEPLNAVDKATREIVDDVLCEHARRGGSVLVATHDLGSLTDSFDAAAYMCDGRISQIASISHTTASL